MVHYFHNLAHEAICRCAFDTVCFRGDSLSCGCVLVAMAHALSAVEAHRVVAVLEETLEKLTFLDRSVDGRCVAKGFAHACVIAQHHS